MSRYGSSAAVLDERDEGSEEAFEVTDEQEEELARRLEDSKSADLVPLNQLLDKLRRP